MFKKYTKKYNFSYIILFLFAILIIGYYLSPFLLCYIDTNEKITVTSIGTGIIAITGLYFFSQRLQKQQKQIDLQIEHRTDQRFTDSIGLLGSSETSARTGAIYSLYQLALDDDKNKYRSQITQILCSHIRSTTREPSYKTIHKNRPSNEIQTCINLLFKENGLYQQDFAAQHNFPKADLSYAYLIYANFDKAQCQGADFRKAQCQGVYFRKAQCQLASFYKAQCQGADFYNAECQGTDFCKAQCQGADFYGAQCQGASFRKAQCQGAYTDSIQTLSERIGKDTELNNIVFNGEVSIEAVAAIESAKPYLNDYNEILEKIITDNKGKEPTNKPLPKGIITGVLEDSKEIQAIIDKLKQTKRTKHRANNDTNIQKYPSN